MSCDVIMNTAVDNMCANSSFNDLFKNTLKSMAISGTKVRSVSVLMAYLDLVFVFSRFLVLFSSILVVSIVQLF